MAKKKLHRVLIGGQQANCTEQQVASMAHSGMETFRFNERINLAYFGAMLSFAEGSVHHLDTHLRDTLKANDADMTKIEP